MKKPAGLPLDGIRVLDFSHVLAGPMCTRLLVDLGAEVLRVESTKRADTPWRSTSDPDLKRMYAYIMVHRGKKSITIDLKSTSGGDIARKLAAVADVVVENFSADVMNRLGLGYDRLSELNPRLIYLSMSGYGHDGPRKHWTSMNSNLQAYAGMMMITEQEGNPPVAVSNSWMDYVGGLHGCYSVLQALINRKRDGKGRNIDMAQFECGVGSIGPLLLAGILNGKRPERIGNRSTKAAPQGCYACAGEDQWCAISVENDEQWQALVRTIGNSAMAQDPRLQSLAGRMRHHGEIDRHIAAWARGRAAAEVARLLHEAGVPAEHMRRMDEIMQRRDGSVFRLEPGKERPILMTGLPFSFVPRKKQEFGPTPRLGEHTDEALQSWLGLEAGAIGELRTSGILS
jgi:crotonobetainyl-CoA:carnitine CoA-transferase CaiB-like acyl-CoA transferase